MPLAWRVAVPRADPGRFLVVRTAGSAERLLDAGQDAEVVLEGPLGPTRLCVQDGAAWIASSPCPNQLCRRMGRLRRPGRVLVCLPNRVLVRFVAAGRDVDAVTR